ncbi:MAG: Holliday junction resolvase, partial [Proteobacteria bacterium]
MRVLGIDPGSNFMGLGCVEAHGNAFTWIGHRVVRVAHGTERTLSDRFKSIHDAV